MCVGCGYAAEAAFSGLEGVELHDPGYVVVVRPDAVGYGDFAKG